MRQMSKIHILLEWLISICIISVGFSGWAITMPSEPILAKGSMNTYPVIRAEEYIEFGSVMLSHGNYGFIGDSVTIGGNGAEFGDNGLIFSNTGSLMIPVTLKSVCFSDPKFSANCMTIEIALQIADKSGNVNKGFFNLFTITQSCDVGNTGIKSKNADGTNPSYNGTTGELTLRQKLDWGDTVTGNQTIYISVNLELLGDEDDPKQIELIFNSLQNVNIKTNVKNS